MMDDRQEFLINMYNQLFNDINRHITLTWQAIGVIGGSAAILALIEKKIITIELAVTLIVFLCFWGMNILIDSAYWYRRNQVMIGNIEKQFLEQSDQRDICHYFGRHPGFSFIGHLHIQFVLMVSILGTFLFFNAEHNPHPILNFQNSLTLALSIITAVMYDLNRRKYIRFVETCPGKKIESLVVKPIFWERKIDIETPIKNCFRRICRRKK